MNISELARRLKVNPDELRDKLPGLGFDIGKKAIKIDDRLAYRILRSWKEALDTEREKQAYLKYKQVDESGEVAQKGDLKIPPVLTVKDFASLLDVPLNVLIKELMKNGVMATLNQRIDFDTAAIIAEDLGYTAVLQQVDEEVELEKEAKIKKIMADEKDDHVKRPPVIVVMGHVDHGKTRLLDAIRQTDVVAGESGGITQHIGAYQIHKNDRLITFIDTPGHEAFSAMRSRGAKVADVAILVVAANDGVKPQTVEAQKIAEAAGLPIIVAINKIDLPDANVEKTKKDLAEINLMCEDWGGKIPCVEISAKEGLNISDLIETVLLVADVEEEKIMANPDGEMVGTIVESHVDKGLGPVATLIVKNGTLRKGDLVLVDGDYYGKVRLMHDYSGDNILEASPSTPAQLIGLKVAPKVGDVVEVSKEKVKKVKAYKLERKEDTFVQSRVEEIDENDDVVRVNIVLRTDVLGSQEAIIEALEKLSTEDFKLKFVTKGLGNVTETDVQSADATGAMLLAFNTVPSNAAQSLAKEKKVEIQSFKIIYELIDAVKDKVNSLFKPTFVREDLGKVKIKAIFNTEKTAMIIGGVVTSGKVENNTEVGILRDEEFVASGKIVGLQSGKLEVTDVLKGQECGIRYEGKPLIEEGDVLDVYKMKEILKAV